MNVSFIAFGLMWSTGAYFLSRSRRFPFDSSWASFPLMLAGAGAAMVGVFPENTVSIAHTIGAGVEFFGGLLGFIACGIRLHSSKSRPIGALSFVIAASSLLGFVLFLVTLQTSQKTIFGLEMGAWERLAYWPENLWLLAAGILIKSEHQGSAE
jgi:hypothetical membrane protein